MLDKWLCKKFKLGKITLENISDAVLLSNIMQEITIIVFMFEIAYLICMVAECGLIAACIDMFLIPSIMAVCVYFVLNVVGKKVTVATCPLKKQ